MADDWKAAYGEAVVIADDLGDLLESILERTMEAMDWVMAAPVRLEKWKAWRERRPAIS